MEENLNELSGMSSSYTMDRRKLGRWPDLGLLFETRVCPGSGLLAETGSRAGK